LECLPSSTVASLRSKSPVIQEQKSDNTYTVIHWADANQVRWAFSTGNAGAYLTAFYNDPAKLTEVDWTAVESKDFRDPKIKEGKQAEFLMFDVFPWTLINQIGAINSTIGGQVETALTNAEHKPIVTVEPTWYF
jgi:hypothetical protein